ncbi:MAG: helix-turn-helix domain-containing protein [Methylobacterium sp.]|uniref:helix-turn-helix domain-containing protein n=1 Tax=Methylobacterium sp. TaxID=409 RepID=UPI0025EA49D2|nr:helix-turn-helix domain-containing protein [Methylobacterium sp.]MBX9932979.1 helix-turn-helix domain-containing protein [Methylobacterium sp.]
MSRATLFRLFEADGGVAAYIRERRLLLAIRLLTEGGGAGRPRVSAVAYASGLSDEKTFSPAFKGRFDMLQRDAESGAAVGLASNENMPIPMSSMKNRTACAGLLASPLGFIPARRRL